MELKKKYPSLSNLCISDDVSSVISRSKQVMEESQALSSINNQKKRQIDEKLKKIITNSEDNSEESIKIIESPKLSYTDLRRSSLDPNLLFQEIQSLNLKLAGQLSYIKTLEGRVGELKTENQKLTEKNSKIRAQHKEEIIYITQMYEEKISGLAQKNYIGLETRMNEIEEKLKIQNNQFQNIEGKIDNIKKTNKGLKKNKRRSSEKFESCSKGSNFKLNESKHEKLELNKNKKS